MPLSEIAKLVNIGTLFAFLIVNVGVIVLRRTQPDMERGFRVPFVPVFPLIGAAPVHLPDDRARGHDLGAVRASGWSLGLVIYFFYGRTHSLLQRGEEPRAAGPRARRGALATDPIRAVGPAVPACASCTLVT